MIAGTSLMKSLSDVASLCILRITLGALLLWEVILFAWNGWIKSDYIVPSFHFTYPGFSWVRPFPAWGMHLTFIVVGVSALLVMLGLFYRASIVILFFGFSYIFLLDQTNYLNHFYLAILFCFVLMFTQAHRDFSLDALLHPLWRRRSIPSYALFVLRTQVVLVYFYGGVAKLNSDWLHGQPLLLWLPEARHLPLLGVLAAKPWFAYLASYAGIAVDFLIPAFLLFPKTRRVGFVVAVLFHALNSVLFDIGIFPPLMVVATALFFSPDWPRRFLNEHRPLPPRGEPLRRESIPWVYAGIVIYLAVQVLFPLRFLLYRGNVSWTGEGKKFSWRMKLNNLDSEVAFTAVLANPRKPIQLQTQSLLTPRQWQAMAIDPELVRQFAHHLKDKVTSQLKEPVEIHAALKGALNGRPLQPWIDPEFRSWCRAMDVADGTMDFAFSLLSWRRLGLFYRIFDN